MRLSLFLRISISTISPGGIKGERHFFFVCIHTVDRKLFGGTGNGNVGAEKTASGHEKECKRKEKQAILYDAVCFFWCFGRSHKCLELVCLV